MLQAQWVTDRVIKIPSRQMEVRVNMIKTSINTCTLRLIESRAVICEDFCDCLQFSVSVSEHTVCYMYDVLCLWLWPEKICPSSRSVEFHEDKDRY